MPEDFTYQSNADKMPKMKVSEAAVEYITGRKEEAVSTISSKNQITLPVHLLRQMGVGPGTAWQWRWKAAGWCCMPVPRTGWSTTPAAFAESGTTRSKR